MNTTFSKWELKLSIARYGWRPDFMETTSFQLQKHAEIGTKILVLNNFANVNDSCRWCWVSARAGEQHCFLSAQGESKVATQAISSVRSQLSCWCELLSDMSLSFTKGNVRFELASRCGCTSNYWNTQFLLSSPSCHKKTGSALAGHSGFFLYISKDACRAKSRPEEPPTKSKGPSGP